MNKTQLLEQEQNAPVLCRDGKLGLLIRYLEILGLPVAGVQVPGEDAIREIPAEHLRPLSGGRLMETL